MSIGIDPRLPVTLCLPYEYNGEPKPVFRCRRLNTAEYLEVCRLYEESNRSTTSQDASDKAFQALAIGMEKWENQIDPSNNESIPFDIANLPRILNADEALALVSQRLVYARISERDKKNS